MRLYVTDCSVVLFGDLGRQVLFGALVGDVGRDGPVQPSGGPWAGGIAVGGYRSQEQLASSVGISIVHTGFGLVSRWL